MGSAYPRIYTANISCDEGKFGASKDVQCEQTRGQNRQVLIWGYGYLLCIQAALCSGYTTDPALRFDKNRFSTNLCR